MYKFAYYIKDFFARPKIASQANVYDLHQDVTKLCSLCYEFSYLNARDGNSYWYCFLRDIENLNDARAILAKNGIRGRLHFSRFRYGRPPALRVRTDKIRNNSFVKHIDMYQDSLSVPIVCQSVSAQQKTK